MDQRKVNVLAREYCEEIGKKEKPIIVSHHMVMGLRQGHTKMSKSDSSSAIFMEDSAADVEYKINSAYCPIGQIEGNPIIDYTKNIVFPALGRLKISRSEKHGGDLHYESYEALEKDYVANLLHPKDLKKAVA